MAFDVDVSPQDAARFLGAQYVSDLGIGDKATISYGDLCVDGGKLHVMAETELSRVKSDVLPTYQVTRETGGTVSLRILPAKQALDILGLDAGMQWPILIKQMRSSCNLVGQRLGSWVMFPVTTVNGFSSLSELVRSIKDGE